MSLQMILWRKLALRRARNLKERNQIIMTNEKRNSALQHMHAAAIEIVVCRYHEQPDWVGPWSRILPVTVYDKGGETAWTHSAGHADVWSVPNVGRESQAWMAHLLKRRELDVAAESSEFVTTPRHTIFLQANPSPHTGQPADVVIANALILAARDIPYAPLSNYEIVCDEDGEPHHPGLPMAAGWRALFTDADGKWPGVPEEFRGFAGGQFIVRNDVIAQYSPSFYFRGNELCNKEQNPKAAYVIERLWHHIWMTASKACLPGWATAAAPQKGPTA